MVQNIRHRNWSKRCIREQGEKRKVHPSLSCVLFMTKCLNCSMVNEVIGGLHCQVGLCCGCGSSCGAYEQKLRLLLSPHVYCT